MKKIFLGCAGVLALGVAAADSLEGVDRMVCSSGIAQICLENGECYSATPWELSMPDFVVIDTRRNTISTTKGSGEKRSTEFSKAERVDGLIYLQGIEGGRAFSFVIDELTGRMTVAVSRDGMSVTVFGACTDSDV